MVVKDNNDLEIIKIHRDFDREQIRMNKKTIYYDKLKEACWFLYLEMVEEFRYKKEKEILSKIKNNEIKHIEEVKLLALKLKEIDKLTLNEEIVFNDYFHRINNIISEMKMDIEGNINSKRRYKDIWSLIEESKVDFRNIDKINHPNIEHFLKLNRLFLELESNEKQFLRYEWNEKIRKVVDDKFKMEQIIDFLQTKNKEIIYKFISWIIVQGKKIFNDYIERGICVVEEYIEQYKFSYEEITYGDFGGVFRT
jgi:hypothetical protein